MNSFAQKLLALAVLTVFAAPTLAGCAGISGQQTAGKRTQLVQSFGGTVIGSTGGGGNGSNSGGQQTVQPSTTIEPATRVPSTVQEGGSAPTPVGETITISESETVPNHGGTAAEDINENSVIEAATSIPADDNAVAGATDTQIAIE